MGSAETSKPPMRNRKNSHEMGGYQTIIRNKRRPIRIFCAFPEPFSQTRARREAARSLLNCARRYRPRRPVPGGRYLRAAGYPPAARVAILISCTTIPIGSDSVKFPVRTVLLSQATRISVPGQTCCSPASDEKSHSTDVDARGNADIRSSDTPASSALMLCCRRECVEPPAERLRSEILVEPRLALPESPIAISGFEAMLRRPWPDSILLGLVAIDTRCDLLHCRLLPRRVRSLGVHSRWPFPLGSSSSNSSSHELLFGVFSLQVTGFSTIRAHRGPNH